MRGWFPYLAQFLALAGVVVSHGPMQRGDATGEAAASVRESNFLPAIATGS